MKAQARILLVLLLSTLTGFCLSAQYYDKDIRIAAEKMDYQLLDSLLTYKADSLRQLDSLEKYILIHALAGDDINYYQQQKYPLSIELFEKVALSKLWRQPQTASEWRALARNNIFHAYVLQYIIGDFQQAVPLLEEVRKWYEENGLEQDMYFARFVCRDLANIYTRHGEYSGAESLLKQFLRIAKKNAQTDYAVDASSDLAICLYSAGKYPEALQVLEQADDLTGNDPFRLAKIIGTRAQIMYEYGDYPAAIKNSINAIDYLDKVKHPGRPELLTLWRADAQRVYGRALLAAGEHEKAQEATQKALDTLMGFFKNESRREIAKVQLDNAEELLARNRFEPSLKVINSVLENLLTGFVPKQLEDLPDPSSLYAENTLARALRLKSEVYQKQADSGQEELLNLKRSLASSLLVFDVERELRRKHYFQKSKLQVISGSGEWVAKAINAALRIYELTGDKEALYNAFQFAERSRAVLLREIYNKKLASQTGLIAQDQVVHGKLLADAVTSAEEKLYLARTSEADNNQLLNLDNQRLNARQNYADWLRKLEQQHPEYRKLKYANTVSIASIRDELYPEQAILEFFIYEDVAYLFYLDKNKFEVYPIKNAQSLSFTAKKLRQNIVAFTNSEVSNSSCEEFIDLAAKLYQQLFPEDLPKKVKEWVIIPSGPLGLVPFEALLKEKPDHCNFAKMRYLLHDIAISYAYSAESWRIARAGETVEGKSAVFTPQFMQSSGWSKIPGASEATGIFAEKYNWLKYNGELATIEHFEEVAHACPLLHLGTHAKTDAQAEDFSFIVFSDGKGGLDSLFVQDIYELDIQAELVLLSACETGDGKHYQGEGIISPARAFMAAGARSVATTLWPIYDDINNELLKDFYQFLYQGKNKSQALHHAKVSHLNKADAFTGHPAYWSAYILLGDSAPLQNEPLPWWWAVMGLIALLVAILIWRNYSQRQVEQLNIKHRENRERNIDA